MDYSLLQELSNKSKTGLVKRQIVELYRSSICTEKQILLVKRRTRRISTTISHYHFFKYPNLIIGKRIAQPNALWRGRPAVSDVTYFPVLNRFSYLSLVTDAYSRKIVGWSLRPSLAVEGPVSALKSVGVIQHSHALPLPLVIIADQRYAYNE